MTGSHFDPLAMGLELAAELLRKTTAGALFWKSTTREDMVSQEFENGVSVLLYSKDEDTAPPFNMDVLDGEGRIVVRLSTELIAPNQANLLSELYENAMQKRVNVQETLNDLLRYLRNMPDN